MINGLINVNKEAGWTSFDVVAKLRGITGQRKIGHTGTLDPDATGVLPVALGRATKIVELLASERKTYRAEMLLGVDTDTQDISGAVLRRSGVACSEEEVRAAAESFLGEQMQVPPMYSALKVNGKKLYELAREGKVIERKPRPVSFYAIRILSADLPRVTLEVTCSRGTYIRTLCHDIGEKLGCGACMSELTRTQVGPFRLEDARTVEQIGKLAAAGALQEAIIPLDRMFESLPALRLPEEYDKKLHNGNAFAIPPAAVRDQSADGGAEQEILPDCVRVRVYDAAGRFVGIYALQEGNAESLRYQPEKMFYDQEA